ncbi:serine/threonine-protein kinase [Amycolatopsis saalfeldensis]|uniref:non-specific serine/threonine protein kinase n=1 Tax=Amycolatopsis saalfeldensis TaxID=394193 RepID=A0A1H8Y1L6_9PSEU|nr:serine/threonine-protein kinase [Amycolatopsis saalfeldensis]SEP46200.1 Serine/threonine protein kinase [Amycolatopsis saalfeldensis]
MTDAEELDAGTTARRFDLGLFGPPPAVVAGRYVLGDLLGQGATARVHRAHDQVLDRAVAVKLFHPGTVELGRGRRAQEVQALRALQHPGLVGLYDAGTDEGHAYLAMQLAEGPNLATRLAGGPLPTDEVTQLGGQLAEALAHVHAHGVTHRDLKPANILLAYGRALIADFGVARLVDATRVTATGATVGTAAYLAPEQVLGERPGPPADVYALGLVLLECVSGVREYQGTPAESAVVRLHRQPDVPEGLPEPLSATLRAMTAREPSARPTAAAVARALRGEGEIAPPPRGRRRLLLWAAAAAVPLAAVGAALLLNLTSPANGAGPEPAPAPAAAPPASTVTPLGNAVNPPGDAMPGAPLSPPTATQRVPVVKDKGVRKADHPGKNKAKGPVIRHHGKNPQPK